MKNKVVTSNSPITAEQNFVLDCGGVPFDCRPGSIRGAHVMGILNVTPDSFSDGGAYPDLSSALRRVEQMLEEGAAIIDVGGESTRPRGGTYGAGAIAVDLDRERQRILPVIESIRTSFPDALISIDTYKPGIARAAVDAGAHLINDVTGLRLHPEMAAVAAASNTPLILMHSLGRPGEMPHSHRYADVTAEVCTSLQESIALAVRAGANQIVTDPGFGFGKTPQENLKLINDVSQFVALGYPVLVGISRKSTIGAMLGGADTPASIDERLFGTLGATAVAVLRGASIVRTHDVRPTAELLKLLGETVNAD